MLSPTLLVIIIGGAVLLIGAGIASVLRDRDPTSGGGFNPNVIVVLLLIFGGAMLVVYSQLEKWMVKNKYGDRIANMCETTVFTDFSKNNLTSDRFPPRILIMGDNGKRHEWHDDLPDVMRAEDRESTDIVACVMSKKHQQVMETCNYESYSSGKVFTVSRVQYYRNVYLVDAATGLPIATIVAWGAGPEYCPQTIVTANRKLMGSDPKYTYFYDALYQFLQEY
jgi:hypothetical protein